ncbi:hypothetical protein KR018_000058 [Drosophila ironensis]|nr:hypothetical protein KR018_000058 [Drosophila ironensis]
MSIFDNPEQLRALRDLLNPRTRRGGQACSSSEDEDESMVASKLNPGSIGAPQPGGSTGKAKGKNEQNPYVTPLLEEEKQQPKTLEQWEEQQEREDKDILETRKSPEYTMTYRQAVGTEDVFLQMGNRTGSSASCEDIVLEILLPGEEMAVDKMNLSLQEKELDLGTCLYRLRLPLPHPVDVDKCQAQFDSELRKLRLTLRLKRELDFVNF